MVRALREDEVLALLDSDTVAHLATVDGDGYPHVTPIWFAWADGVFHLTSYRGRPHLDRILADPRVGLVIDDEAALRGDGQRPNRQIRIIGHAIVTDDEGGRWTSQIRRRYRGTAVGTVTDRALITITPVRQWSAASV